MLQESKITIDNLCFDIITSGEKSNKAVMLLHGFPETNYMWKTLMNQLTENGYYCIVPNMRGYSSGAQPKGIKNYTIDKLANDILRISEALNIKRFHLIGHDWGAGIGWYFVHKYPEKIISWTALSVPHTKAFNEAKRVDKTQQKMSTYIGLFQIPWFPELKIKKNDFELFKKLWKDNSIEVTGNYLTVFKKPNVLTSALNYYRENYGMFKRYNTKFEPGNIYVPTLFIWGKKTLPLLLMV